MRFRDETNKPKKPFTYTAAKRSKTLEKYLMDKVTRQYHVSLDKVLMSGKYGPNRVASSVKLGKLLRKEKIVQLDLKTLEKLSDELEAKQLTEGSIKTLSIFMSLLLHNENVRIIHREE